MRWNFWKNTLFGLHHEFLNEVSPPLQRDTALAVIAHFRYASVYEVPKPTVQMQAAISNRSRPSVIELITVISGSWLPLSKTLGSDRGTKRAGDPKVVGQLRAQGQINGTM